MKPVYSIRFRPALVPGIAAAVFIALTISLGNWQTRRAEEKLDLARQLDEAARGPVLAVPSQPVAPGAMEHHRVTALGQFAARHTLYLDNKIHDHVAGYHVITPLKIRGGETYVLVNRGWIAAGDRRELPRVATPEGETGVAGIAVAPTRRFLELAPEAGTGPLRQNLVPEREEQRLGLRLQPFVIQQTSEANDRLVRAWERPDTGVDKHRGYALQWYSFAALALVLFIALSVKRTRTGDA